MKELQKMLNDKADKQALDLLSQVLETERKIVDSLEQKVKEIKLKFETLELSTEVQKVQVDDFELEERLVKLISQGHNSPTELIRMLGISADKHYQIINRLAYWAPAAIKAIAVISAIITGCIGLYGILGTARKYNLPVAP